MTKLLSGRIAKVPSANVSSERYQFIELSETEPDLGLPSSSGQVLTSSTAGVRSWLVLDTANVVENSSNLYFTNARVVGALVAGTGISISANGIISATGDAVTSANVITILDAELTTANVIELDNLYFTNARVVSVVTPILTTANIVELTNLYFTNARVVSVVTPILTTANVVENTNLYFTNTRAYVAAIEAVTPILTTGNVVETTNQYFTNTRVLQAVDPKLTTANVTELDNLYFTNARVVQTVTPLLTTSNVIEGINLYFTNARARAAFTGGTGVYVDWNTGTISIGQDVSTTANVTFNNLTLLGNLNVFGNAIQFATNTLVINDTLIQLGVGNPSDALDIGFVGHYDDGIQRHAGIVRDHQTKKYFVFDNYAPEPGNDIQFANAATDVRYATLVASTFEGNVLGTVSSLSNHTTSNLAEGTNQYFTNARVLQAVDPKLTTANVVELDNLYFTNARSRSALSSGTGITYDSATGVISANVSQYTDANVYAALLDANVTIGNLIVKQDIVARGNITAINTIVANSLIIRDNPISDEFLSGRLITANTIVANTVISNVVYANSFVSTGTGTPTLSSVTNLNLSANGDNGSAVVITSSPLRIRSYTQSARANIIASVGDIIYNSTVGAPQFYNGNAWANVGFDVDPLTVVTANVREWSSNLYFTNARVYAALSDANIIVGNIVVRQDIVARGNITAINTIVANSIIIRDNPITDELLRGNITGAYVYTSNVFTNEITANIWNRLYTSNVVETTNLYFTNARSRSAISAGNGITYDSATGIITANVASVPTYNDSNTLAAILPLLTTSNVIEGSNLYFTNTRARDALLNTDVSFNNVTVWGDLLVQGNTVTLSTGTLTVEDKNIVLANGAINAAAADGAGITIDGAQANIKYQAAGDTFVINKNLEVTGNLVVGSTSDLSNVEGIYSLVSRYIIADEITANTWDRLYTSNVIETTNLYFTNQRALDAVNPRLTTANVSELINLYFTNARAVLAITPLLTTSNVVEGTNLYFTNARAYVAAVDAVIPLLTTANVIETTALYFTDGRAINAVTPKLTTANVLEVDNFYYTNARVVQTVTPILNTANVGEKDNLYFTDSRALNAVNPRLTTANVGELNNLYFTNARVLDALVTSDLSANSLTLAGQLYANGLVIRNIEVQDAALAGNVSAGSFTGNSLVVDTITANIWNRLYTSNVIENTNLYFTNARARAALSSGSGITYDSATGIISANVSQYTDANTISVILPYLTTSNVAEGSNLYFTNARVYAPAIEAITPLLTTSNVAEGANLYFTNQRALDAVNPRLTTANVAELNNLYYTDARVNTAVRPILTTANVTETEGNLYFTIQRAIASFIAGENIVIEANGRISAANVISLYSNLILTASDLTTANVLETTQLYYTNARVVQTVTPLLTTSNVVEGTNLYFTNARVYAPAIEAVTPLLTTSNVVEGTNLYFTNARARTSVTGGTGVTVDWNTGTISIGQDVGTSANVTFGSVTITGNLNVLGNAVLFATNTLVINDTLIQLGVGNPSDALDIGFVGHYNDGSQKHSGFIRDHQTKKYFLFDNYSPEPGNDIEVANSATGINYSTLVASAFEGNVLGTVSSLANHTTSNLAEGTNQYFTNARVLQAVDPKLTTANVTELVNLYFTNARVYAPAIEAVTPLLTTGNVVETTNQYFTNVRVLQAVDPKLTTANVAELNNLYYTDGRVVTAVTPLLTTSNVVEGSNLYFTNARSRFAISAGNGITYDSATGVITANVAGVATYNDSNAIAAITPLLTTSNVAEGSNLYFTTGRVVTTVTPLLTTSNVIEGTNLYFTNARVLSALATADVLANSLTLAGQLYANGLVIRNISVSDSVLAGNVTGSAVTGNTIVTDSITANIWNGLYTANVIETSGNLYFTNARVQSYLNSLVDISIGLDAGNVNQGTAAIALGYAAGFQNQGNDTVAIGLGAGAADQADRSVAIGAYAGQIYQSTLSVAIGYQTGNQNQGQESIAIGRLTGYENQGSYSVAIGALTAQKEQKQFAVAIGKFAGQYNQGTSAIAIGVSAGQGVEAVDGQGNSSIAIGSDAGKFGFGDDAIAIGKNAGASNAVRSSISIGVDSGYGAGENSISIGKSARGVGYGAIAIGESVEGANNSITIGYKGAGQTSANTIVINATREPITTSFYTEGLYINPINEAYSVDPTANILLWDRSSKEVLWKNVNSILENVDVRANSLTLNGQIRANGLVIRGITVSDSTLSGNVTATAVIGNTIVTSNIIMDEITGNIAFLDQLYVNGATVQTLSAGTGISIANGIISAPNISASVYFDWTESQTIATTAGFTSYVMNRQVADPKSIMVVYDGLVQLPSTDYTVTGNVITFTEAITEAGNVEIRFMGLKAADYINPSILTYTNTFTGNASNVAYQLTQSPIDKNHVQINIDGVMQLSDAFNLVGRTLTFTEAPPSGANIEVRIWSAMTTAAFATRTFTADGTANTYTVSPGMTSHSILVFENGVAQVAETDYTYNNTSGVITFTSTPAANVVIHVKELGIATPDGSANVLNALRGRQVVTGALLPSNDATHDIGSSGSRYKDVYASGTISSNSLIISNPVVPTAANSPGTKGTIAYDTNYLYVCVAANTWVRAALSTWPQNPNEPNPLLLSLL